MKKLQRATKVSRNIEGKLFRVGRYLNRNIKKCINDNDGCFAQLSVVLMSSCCIVSNLLIILIIRFFNYCVYKIFINHSVILNIYFI